MLGRRDILDGVRVLDLTQMLAGPLATLQLGDLGAEVVKVENPAGGELSRAYDPTFDGVSAYFAAFNRNKRSVALDLSTEAGRSAVFDLAADADVVVENFKPGTVEKFGVDYESVAAENPDVVYASIKGFARGSVYENEPGIDMVAQAMGGAMAGGSDEPPLRNNMPVADIAAGMYAAQGVLGGLFDREVNDAGGDFVEVSLVDVLVAWRAPRIASSLVTGKRYPRNGNAHEYFAPYNSFETADSHIVVCVATEFLWPKFCRAIGREDLIDDPRFETNSDRMAHEEELYGILDGVFAERTTEEWFERLREHDVPAGPVYDSITMWDDPYFDRERLLDAFEYDGIDATMNVARSPLEFRAADAGENRPPERLGESTEECLREIGYSAEKIERLAGK